MSKQINTFAVLADIHGNALALEAVLADAHARGVTDFVNLGDIFYGPLEPGKTWQLLKDRSIPSVLGNQDRLLLEGGSQWEGVPAYQTALNELGAEGMAWLRALPATQVIDGDVFLCHGTPRNDGAYLLEDVATGVPVIRDEKAIVNDSMPEAEGCSLVLAGHSHLPGAVQCGDTLVVNPGSVGLPAYDDDVPPHVMESGSPHARYAIVKRKESGWKVEFLEIVYDWETAARLAKRNNREDWGRWLMTGKG